MIYVRPMRGTSRSLLVARGDTRCGRCEVTARLVSAVLGVVPAIPAIGGDNAAPAGEDVMGEDQGRPTRHGLGDQTLA